jgi:F-box-like
VTIIVLGLVCHWERVTIGSLPDEVLLEIFDFYQVAINEDEREFPWNWEKLVHVCRRWRYLIFESPNRLDLQLFCTQKSPVRKLLGVWPPIPLAILFRPEWDNLQDSFDDLMAALEHCDRIRQIQVNVNNPPDFVWEKIVTAMAEPFPALRSLSFESISVMVPLPDTFLNGSVASLRYLYLRLQTFSFPSLPQLLSSTSDLRSLHLVSIPESGYIPPETMATCLSALPKLESLTVDFISPTPHPQRRNRAPPPSTRFVLPALTKLEFTGISEYLEGLAARVDAPLLDESKIGFFHQPELDFDIPQTIRFFGHLKRFRPSSLTLAFNPPFNASIFFSLSTLRYPASPHLWRIKCQRLDWQVASLAQICSQILPFCSSVESLIIKSTGYWWPRPNIDIDSTLWFQLFHSFPSVQSLSIRAELVPFIALALQGATGESAAEVFPLLRTLYVIGNKSGDAAQQSIQSFITARLQSGRPVDLLR